jgi:hypothetical protein
MNPPRSSITADRGHNKPTPKCVVFFVEQISANHTIRFAEQLCLNGHQAGACNNQQRGLARRIRPPGASNQRRQGEERRASRCIPVYVRHSELLWTAVNGGVV